MHICNSASSVWIQCPVAPWMRILLHFTFPPCTRHKHSAKWSDSNCRPAEMPGTKNIRPLCKNQPFKLYTWFTVCFHLFASEFSFNSLSSVCASMHQFHRDWLCNRNRSPKTVTKGDRKRVGFVVDGLDSGGIGVVGVRSPPPPDSTWRSWSWTGIGWRRWWRR